MKLTDIFKFKLFEGTDKADLEVVNENFQAAEDAMQAHAAGGDHDGRYLKKAEVVNNNTTTAAGYALDARQANPNVVGTLGAQILALVNGLASHKTSGDHDGRYYTEAEVNNLLARYYLKTDVDNKIINAKPSVNNISSSAAVTIGSGSTADITISVAASGKTPILATCIDTGNHMCYVCALTLIGNNVTIRLKNNSTVGGVSCRPTVRVLYTTN